MPEDSWIKVKLNKRGWEIYRKKNGFAEGNVDDEGYSTFSYDYFETLFSPLPLERFSDGVIWDKEDKDTKLIRYFLRNIDTKLLVYTEQIEELEKKKHELYREQGGLLKDLNKKRKKDRLNE